MDEFLEEKVNQKLKVSEEPEVNSGLSPADKPVLDLPEQYTIIETLGQGGMGTVYKARHEQLGTYVAIKVINPDLLAGKLEKSENAQKRFINESKAVSHLQHENVVTLKDFGVTPSGSLFMVMEYAEGKTLDTMIKGSPMDYKAALNIVRGVCDGLAHAHELGLVHRDIKPSNIIVGRSAAGREVPKLVDFGIARITGEDGKTQGLTSTGEVFGSPYCIAPEQSLSSKVDRRADIYSLGCVLFECVTGKPPYSGDTAMHTIMMHLNSPIPSASATLGKSLPKGLEHIINRCLQKDPNKRYQSAADLKADIESLLAGKTVRHASLAGGDDTHKKILKVLFAGLAVIVIGTAGIITLVNSNQNNPQTNQSIEDAAYNEDMGEAYSAFLRGDYNRCIILQKGAIGVYEDQLEEIERGMLTARGAKLKELNDKKNRLLFLKAENLKHVGDCYRLLKQDEMALSYYQKGLEIFRRWAFTGYHSKDMDECYQYAIELLNTLGRAADAQSLKAEQTRSLKSGGH